MVHGLRGMFAFAIWDARKRRGLLARDRLGIKPLFVYERGEELRFGSEIKALLAGGGVSRTIDPVSLDAYLAQNYVAAPRTLLSEVRQLEPGELMVFEKGRSVRRRYWDLHFDRGPGEGTPSQWVDRLQEKLEETVRRHLVADVPVGALLSGGIDSTTLVSIVRAQHRDQTMTFTADFAEASYGEGRIARQMAAALGASNEQVVFGAPSIDLLRRIVAHAEEPTADLSMPAFYAVCELAGKRVKVAVSGEGADEVLAGYETFTASYLGHGFRRLPTSARRAIARAVEALPESESKISAQYKLKRFVRGVEAPETTMHLAWRRICEPELRRELVGDASRVIETHGSEVVARATSQHPLERMIFTDVRYYLPNALLVKADRMSMAHGLEVRVPYLDHEFVELASAAPPNLKLRHFTGRKWLLRRVADRVLPAGVRLPTAKKGFNLPMVSWLRGPLKEPMLDLLSRGSLKKAGLLRPEAVERVIDEHLRLGRDRSFELYGMLVLSLWADEVLGREDA
jgi:asparagine synthase (glutamine-hydrolysing)